MAKTEQGPTEAGQVFQSASVSVPSKGLSSAFATFLIFTPLKASRHVSLLKSYIKAQSQDHYTEDRKSSFCIWLDLRWGLQRIIMTFNEGYGFPPLKCEQGI